MTPARQGVDAPTRAGLFQLATYCWLLYAIGPITLLLRDELTLDRAEAAAHSTAMAVGFVLAGIASPRLMGAVPEALLRRRTLQALASGMILLALGHLLAVTLAAVLICGLSGAVLVNVLNHSVVGHHGPRSASALSTLNAAGATAGITAPLLIGFGVGHSVSWRWLVIACAIVTITASVRPIRPFGVHHTGQAGRTQLSGAGDATPRTASRYRSAVVALLAGMVVEFTVSLFASDAMRTQTGLGTGAATAWAAAFMVGFAGGRWLAARLARDLPAGRLMSVAFTVCALGACLVAQGRTPAVCGVGLLLLGLGCGPAYPLLMSLALGSVPGDASRAVARIGAVSGVVIGLAPFALGRLADVDGLGIPVVFISLCGTSAAAAALVARSFVYASQHPG